jgi:hypothetical protein
MLTKLHLFIFFCFTGIIISNKRPGNIELIYRKYFGDDYRINYNGRYGSIISNHISWSVKIKIFI